MYDYKVKNIVKLGNDGLLITVKNVKIGMFGEAAIGTAEKQPFKE